MALFPNMLSNLFPPTVGTCSNISYQLRNVHDYQAVPRRRVLFSNSFIPSAVSLWNNLPENIDKCDIVSSFKTALLKQLFKAPIVPPFFITGNRKYSIIHARFRNGCSNLNFDRKNNRLIEDSSCESCGYDQEDAEHFFFHCPSYDESRLRLFR